MLLIYLLENLEAQRRGSHCISIGQRCTVAGLLQQGLGGRSAGKGLRRPIVQFLYKAGTAFSLELVFGELYLWGLPGVTCEGGATTLPAWASCCITPPLEVIPNISLCFRNSGECTTSWVFCLYVK